MGPIIVKGTTNTKAKVLSKKNLGKNKTHGIFVFNEAQYLKLDDNKVIPNEISLPCVPHIPYMQV
jgi:hypothetical protein